MAEILGVERNARNGLADGDLKLPPDCPYSFEVKRTGRRWVAIYAAVDQAQGYQPAKKPVALIRDDRREWLAVFRLEDIKGWML